MLRPTAALLFAWVACAPPLSAQDTPGLGPEGEVGAALTLRPGLTAVHGSALPLLGIGLALRPSRTLEIGGEAVLGLGRVGVSPAGSPDRSHLTLGYGGLQVRYRTTPDTTFGGWDLSLLAGAGTARIRSTLAGSELGSENFGVVEPSFAYRWSLREGLGAGLSLGYRVVFADEPLPGMSSSELDGPVLSLVLHLVRDP